MGLDENRRAKILDRESPLSRHTSNTIADLDALREELATIRERGVSFNREERLKGMRAVAAPVRNHSSGEMLGALAVAGPANRFQGKYYEERLPTPLFTVLLRSLFTVLLRLNADGVWDVITASVESVSIRRLSRFSRVPFAHCSSGGSPPDRRTLSIVSLIIGRHDRRRQ